MQNPAPTVMTIAGFDPSSGAGITADLMVFAAHGLFGTSAITSLTVQSTIGVQASYPVSGEKLSATLRCLHEDMPPAGVKIGMLATAANVVAVADYLGELRQSRQRIPVVLDPVIRSSSGRELLSVAGVGLLQRRLLPCVDWITPNLDELRVLTGRPITKPEDIPDACRALQGLSDGKLGILATGGHLDPPDDLLVTPDGKETWLRGERIASTSTHGTGCALSSAFMCRLVLGDSPEAAALAAKQYVAQAIRFAIPRGQGYGPLNHLWPLR